MCTGLLPPGANPIAVKILIIIIIIINIGTEYFKHALYSPFFLLKMQLVS